MLLWHILPKTRHRSRFRQERFEKDTLSEHPLLLETFEQSRVSRLQILICSTRPYLSGLDLSETRRSQNRDRASAFQEC